MKALVSIQYWRVSPQEPHSTSFWGNDTAIFEAETAEDLVIKIRAEIGHGFASETTELRIQSVTIVD